MYFNPFSRSRIEHDNTPTPLNPVVLGKGGFVIYQQVVQNDSGNHLLDIITANK